MLRYAKIFTLLLITVFQGKGFLFSQNLMHYTSDSYRYSIMVPEEWRRKDEIKSKNVSLVLLSPDEAAISVSFMPMLDEASTYFIDGYIGLIESSEGIFQLIEKGIFKNRDGECEYVIFTYEKENVAMREKVCFFQRKGEMAVVSAKQTDDKFNESIAIFDKVFKSFTFETDQEKVEGEH